MGEIVLCADAESLRRPALIGLDGVKLDGIPWLKPFSDASEARSFLRSARHVNEVWVVSSDQVDAINLAAALKKDNAARRILLALFDVTGSALSRARAAGVSGTLSRQGLAKRFAIEQRRHAACTQARAGTVEGARAAAMSGPSPQAQGGMPCVGAPVSTAAFGTGAPDPLGASGTDARAASGAADAKGHACGDGAHARGESERVRPDAATRKGGRALLLTVASGGGGAGKSAVATTTAHLLARRGLKVLLLDCDLQFGDVCHLSGARNPTSIFDLTAEGAVARFLEGAAEADAPRIVSAPQRLEQAEIVERHLPRLLDELADGFDMIVANTGSAWGECQAVLLERSACVLFLVDQRSSSVRACRHALELCARCGIATGSFSFAVNRCSRGSLFTSIDVSCALQGAHVSELKDGGDEVEELLGSGMAGDLAASQNDFASSLDALLEEILPSSLAGKGRRGGKGKTGMLKARGAGSRLARRTRSSRRRRGGPAAVEARSSGEGAGKEMPASAPVMEP